VLEQVGTALTRQMIHNAIVYVKGARCKTRSDGAAI
jgi:hypothetical protein